MVEIQSGARYVIVNAKSGTAVDLNGADNKSIIGFPRHGGPNQQWETIQVDGGWHIRNVKTGTYLTFEGQVGDGRHIVATSQPFKWHIWTDEVDTNGVRVCVPDTRHNLDLSDHGNPSPGTPVALWGRWKGENQIWYFEKVN